MQGKAGRCTYEGGLYLALSHGVLLDEHEAGDHAHERKQDRELADDLERDEHPVVAERDPRNGEERDIRVHQHRSLKTSQPIVTIATCWGGDTHVDDNLLPVLLQALKYRHPFLVGEQVIVRVSELLEVHPRRKEHDDGQHILDAAGVCPGAVDCSALVVF